MPSPLPGFAFRPDPAAADPLYLQLTSALTHAIRAGDLPVGTRLPSERLYAEHLGVSRTTITAAYQELKSLGLLRGHVGRGVTIIADDPGAAPAGPIAWSQRAAKRTRLANPGSTETGLISFGNGWLHPSLIPGASLASCAAKVLETTAVLTEATPILGLGALRHALVERLRATGIATTADNILITGGAQSGLNVIARALLSPGDLVVCETPSWHGAARAFRAAGADLAGVAMDREGIDPDALEDALIRLRPKFVYLIPSFHCPTGRLLDLARRRRILEICTRLRTPIVESHVYGDLAFDRAPPSLKSLDDGGIVIHQSSASKTVSAALRLGWLVAPEAALELLAPAKASLDLSTPALPQAILAHFLASGGYARHVANLRVQLQSRRDALLAALAAHCPELRCLIPQGGLYLWAQLPKPLTGIEVEAAAAAHGVSVRAGETFLPDGGTARHIRLCYAAPALEQIMPGAEKLGLSLRGLLARHTTPGTQPVFAEV